MATSNSPKIDFDLVSTTITLPDMTIHGADIEETVAQYWEKENIFAACEEQNANKPLFIPYEGPPFATGQPHFGHILTCYVKDTVSRFARQTGHRVPADFGWDCHGVPVETLVSKELGFFDRNSIMEYTDTHGNNGIAAFNEACRNAVYRCKDDWAAMIRRIGRFVHLDTAYQTMDVSYMESVWWVFSQLYKAGRIYKGYKVMPFSPMLSSVLANFEASQNEQTVKDPSILLACPIVDMDTTTTPFNVPNMTLLENVSLSDLQCGPISFLIWTTTPWTLPANLALCCHPTLQYCLFSVQDLDKPTNTTATEQPLPETRYFIAVSARIDHMFPTNTKKSRHIVRKLAVFPGRSLEGLHYEPFFDYYSSNPYWKSRAWRVLCDDYVSDSVGSGLVHIAPFFGEDDHRVATLYGVIQPNGPVVCPVDQCGRYTSEVTDFVGRLVTERVGQSSQFDPSKPWLLPKAGPGEPFQRTTNQLIIDKLLPRGLVIERKEFEHNYPYCWRTNSPLIYCAVPSWFLQVDVELTPEQHPIIKTNGSSTTQSTTNTSTATETSTTPPIKNFKQYLLETNETSQWTPAWIQTGRFTSWLANSRDWAISRSRFWGTPMPLWVSEDDSQIVCIGSIHELEQQAGLPSGSVTDLHSHKIDHITIPDPRGDGYPPLRRITEVFDCWFESGSMPYAQSHFPFAQNADLTQLPPSFPADFIAEGIDQTRGWFYTLLVIGTALYGMCPFKKVLINGLVLAPNGQKMSKSLQNFTPPIEIMNRFGADALRLYLLRSPAIHGDSLQFTDSHVHPMQKSIVFPLWHALFFVLENIKRFNGESIPVGTSASSQFVYDPQWLVSHCNAIHNSSSNVPSSPLTSLDIWIISRLHSFLVSMHSACESLQLAICVNNIDSFLDELCNTYLRLNRVRAKLGDVSAHNDDGNTTNDSHDVNADFLDRFVVLTVLTYVIQTFVVALAPFAPFLAEAIFQHLRALPCGTYVPAATSLPPPPSSSSLSSSSQSQSPLIALSSVRSVHLMSYPEPIKEYISPVHETCVEAVSDALELVRSVRQQHSLSVLLPLKHLIIASTNPAIVQHLPDYFQSLRTELNIENIEVCDQPSLFVSESIKIDRQVGKRLGKDFSAVVNQLNNFTPEDITLLKTTGSVTLSGHTLQLSDVEIVCQDRNTIATGNTNNKRNKQAKNAPVPAPSPSAELSPYKDYQVAFKHNIVVGIDCHIYPEMVIQRDVRAIISSIQQWRKACGVRPTTEHVVYYQCSLISQTTREQKSSSSSSPSQSLDQTIAQNHAAMQTTLRYPFLQLPQDFNLNDDSVASYLLRDQYGEFSNTQEITPDEQITIYISSKKQSN